MTLAFQRARYDPYWTQIEYSAGGSRDALGIETLSESILADLLPGINNQTRRARYYSFWAWVLRDFIRDAQAVHTQAGFYEWLRRREAVLILGYLAHDCQGSIAGTTLGSDVWQGGEAATFPLVWKSLESVEGGAYELYYRGPLQEMNIIRLLDDGKHDALTKTVGWKLADAYGQAVSSTRYVQQFLDATRLRKEDLVDFARSGCLCQIGNHKEERRRLIEAFFRFDTPDIYAVKRLASLCFFLDLINQSNGEPLRRREFRATLYFWSYGSNHAYTPEGNLLEPAQRWRAFQLRQYFVFAVESLWSLFLQRIQLESLTGPQYIAWLLESLDLQALASRFDLKLPSFDARQLPLGALYHAIRDALPDEALMPGPSARTSPLNEHFLTDEVPRREPHLGEVETFAGNALLTLGLIYWRCQPWRELPGWRYVSDTYARERMPMDGYLRHVERGITEEWTVARWLGWFHHRYLWLQHRRVTLDKLLARGRETSKFELVEGAPASANGASDIPRFLGRETDNPKMNGPRFPNALDIMEDLALIEPLENGGYRLMLDGTALLERFRDYTVPEWIEASDEETTDGTEEENGG